MKLAITLVALLAITVPASAEMYSVVITGSVDFSQVSFGQFADVVSGDPIVVELMVDSDDFIDSASFPTRAYAITDFDVTIGGIAVGFQDPYPAGLTPYFVIRDNDPAVDGFFLSHGTDFPTGLFIDEPANVDDFFGVSFNVTYGGELLDSLDIAGATGTYDFDGLTVFGFALTDGPFEAMFFIYEQMTITGGGVAVEPRSLSQVKALFE